MKLRPKMLALTGVIVMSGYTEDEGLRRWVSDGSVRFLQRPFDLETLGREVTHALRGEGFAKGPEREEELIP